MQKNNNIGALWIATDKATGQPKVTRNNTYYYTGNIEINGQKINITMFPNNKTKETQPDFNIALSPQKPTGQTQFTQNQPQFPTTQPQNQPEEQIKLDEIPF
jgi:hypothetical protein